MKSLHNNIERILKISKHRNFRMKRNGLNSHLNLLNNLRKVNDEYINLYYETIDFFGRMDNNNINNNYNFIWNELKIYLSKNRRSISNVTDQRKLIQSLNILGSNYDVNISNYLIENSYTLECRILKRIQYIIEKEEYDNEIFTFSSKPELSEESCCITSNSLNVDDSTSNNDAQLSLTTKSLLTTDAISTTKDSNDNLILKAETTSLKSINLTFNLLDQQETKANDSSSVTLTLLTVNKSENIRNTAYKVDDFEKNTTTIIPSVTQNVLTTIYTQPQPKTIRPQTFTTEKSFLLQNNYTNTPTENQELSFGKNFSLENNAIKTILPIFNQTLQVKNSTLERENITTSLKGTTAILFNQTEIITTKGSVTNNLEQKLANVLSSSDVTLIPNNQRLNLTHENTGFFETVETNDQIKFDKIIQNEFTTINPANTTLLIKKKKENLKIANSSKLATNEPTNSTIHTKENVINQKESNKISSNVTTIANGISVTYQNLNSSLEYMTSNIRTTDKHEIYISTTDKMITPETTKRFSNLGKLLLNKNYTFEITNSTYMTTDVQNNTKNKYDILRTENDATLLPKTTDMLTTEGLNLENKSKTNNSTEFSDSSTILPNVNSTLDDNLNSSTQFSVKRVLINNTLYGEKINYFTNLPESTILLNITNSNLNLMTNTLLKNQRKSDIVNITPSNDNLKAFTGQLEQNSTNERINLNSEIQMRLPTQSFETFKTKNIDTKNSTNTVIKSQIEMLTLSRSENIINNTDIQNELDLIMSTNVPNTTLFKNKSLIANHMTTQFPSLQEFKTIKDSLSEKNHETTALNQVATAQSIFVITINNQTQLKETNNTSSNKNFNFTESTFFTQYLNLSEILDSENTNLAKQNITRTLNSVLENSITKTIHNFDSDFDITTATSLISSDPLDDLINGNLTVESIKINQNKTYETLSTPNIIISAADIVKIISTDPKIIQETKKSNLNINITTVSTKIHEKTNPYISNIFNLTSKLNYAGKKKTINKKDGNILEILENDDDGEVEFPWSKFLMLLLIIFVAYFIVFCTVLICLKEFKKRKRKIKF